MISSDRIFKPCPRKLGTKKNVREKQERTINKPINVSDVFSLSLNIKERERSIQETGVMKFFKILPSTQSYFMFLFR